MELRKGTAADLDVLYEIYMDPEVNPFMLFEPMSREQFETELRKILTQDDLYMVEVEKRVAATFRLTRRAHRLAHIAYLGALAVHRDFRGRKLAGRIVTELETRLRAEGIRRLELLVVTDNEKAIRLYRSLGFQVEGTLRGYLKRAGSPDYVDELTMAKMLT